MTLISDDHDARNEVLKVIAETYGDTSVTILDQRCAEAVMLRLREMGWLSPNEFALLTLHGRRDSNQDGGTTRVRLMVDDQTMMLYEERPSPTVTRWREPHMMASSIVIEQRSS